MLQSLICQTFIIKKKKTATASPQKLYEIQKTSRDRRKTRTNRQKCIMGTAEAAAVEKKALMLN